MANVPAVCLDRVGTRAIDLADADLSGLAGHAVLVRTDHARHWGTGAYAVGHPHLTGAAADRLVEAGVACVGIDSLNIDATDDGARPVHTRLLRRDIPIVEHLTALDLLPATGFRFTAVPPKLAGCGTFTVRAYATIG